MNNLSQLILATGCVLLMVKGSVFGAGDHLRMEERGEGISGELIAIVESNTFVSEETITSSLLALTGTEARELEVVEADAKDEAIDLTEQLIFEPP